MTDEYRAVCLECGWKSASPSYSNRPYRRYQDAQRAFNAHAGNNDCDPDMGKVVEI